MVGGPHDGSVWTLAGLGPLMVPLAPVRPYTGQIPADAGLSVPYVEMRPVNTELGWRLYWPHGAS